VSGVQGTRVSAGAGSRRGAWCAADYPQYKRDSDHNRTRLRVHYLRRSGTNSRRKVTNNRRRLELTKPEYEQLNVDIENAIEEFETLSKDVDWFVTDMPDRLRTCLEIIRRAK